MLDDSTSVVEEFVYFLLVGVPVFFIFWGATAIVLRISTADRNRSFDRRSMRFQKRVFFGRMPFGRWRGSAAPSFGRVFAYVARVFLLVLLLMWLTRIIHRMFNGKV